MDRLSRWFCFIFCILKIPSTCSNGSFTCIMFLSGISFFEIWNLHLCCLLHDKNGLWKVFLLAQLINYDIWLWHFFGILVSFFFYLSFFYTNLYQMSSLQFRICLWCTDHLHHLILSYFQKIWSILAVNSIVFFFVVVVVVCCCCCCFFFLFFFLFFFFFFFCFFIIKPNVLLQHYVSHLRIYLLLHFTCQSILWNGKQ